MLYQVKKQMKQSAGIIFSLFAFIFLISLNTEAGAANGFLTFPPVARHGTTTVNASANQSFAQKFVCPGTGLQEISEIGLWAAAKSGTTTTAYFHLAIFNDTGDGSHPGAIVANSDSGELSKTGTTVAKVSYTYATKPVLTGGKTYWLTTIHKDGNAKIDGIATGGNSLTRGGLIYPAWPTDAKWHSHADRTLDAGIYAVTE